MALWVRNKGQSGRTQSWGELDLILDFMMSDYLTATVARSVTPAATECPATVDCRELSSAHTLADNRPQPFFVHKVQSQDRQRDLHVW
jgi:hypothetical protein